MYRMTITAKPQNPPKKNFEDTFLFSLKRCFFLLSLCFFVFFFVLKCKNKKKLVFFLVFAFQNQKKTKKQGTPKRTTSFEAKPKNLFKVLFFGFFGFKVLGLLSFSTYYKLSEKLCFLQKIPFRNVIIVSNMIASCKNFDVLI